MFNYSVSGGYGCSAGRSQGIYGTGRTNYGMNAYCTNSSYAPLEQIIMDTPTESVILEKPAVIYSASYSRLPLPSGLYFVPEAFLNPERPSARFVGKAEEIEHYIREAFQNTTGSELPSNIQITICDYKTMKKIHSSAGGAWSPGIQGFCLNRCGKGTSEIFVKEGALDSVMLTIGHELGHVLTPKLGNAKDEEAKAFAFSIAWMQAITKHNTANLKQCINPAPAQNGLHDTALAFVQNIIRKGKTAFEAYKDIAKGIISIAKQIETIYLC